MKRSTHYIFAAFFPCLITMLTGCHSTADKSMSITAVYTATVILSLLVLAAYFLFVRQKNAWFILLFCSIPIVNIGYQWLSVCTTLESALWANRLSYLGSVVLPVAMLMIILNVLDLRYKHYLPWMLLGGAALMFFIAASPGFSTVYYQSVTLEFVNGVTVLNKVYGILHPLYLLYLIGYFVAMTASILFTSRNRKGHSQTYSILLIIAVFVNIGVWAIEQLSRIDFEFLSVSYIICEMFLLGLNLLMQEYNTIAQPVIPSVVPPVTPPQPSVVAVSDEQIGQFRKGMEELTHTEHKIFGLYLEGKSTKEILALLSITENTLKFHNKNLYSKLGVSSRKQLKEIAKQLHLS